MPRERMLHEETLAFKRPDAGEERDPRAAQRTALRIQLRMHLRTARRQAGECGRLLTRKRKPRTQKRKARDVPARDAGEDVMPRPRALLSPKLRVPALLPRAPPGLRGRLLPLRPRPAPVRALRHHVVAVAGADEGEEALQALQALGSLRVPELSARSGVWPSMAQRR